MTFARGWGGPDQWAAPIKLNGVGHRTPPCRAPQDAMGGCTVPRSSTIFYVFKLAAQEHTELESDEGTQKDTEPHGEQHRDSLVIQVLFFLWFSGFIYDIHLCILCTKVCVVPAADSLFRREGWQTCLDPCQVLYIYLASRNLQQWCEWNKRGGQQEAGWASKAVHGEMKKKKKKKWKGREERGYGTKKPH